MEFRTRSHGSAQSPGGARAILHRTATAGVGASDRQHPAHRSPAATPGPPGAGVGWASPPERPDLGACEVHVWRVALAAGSRCPDEGEDSVSEHERARGRRFRFARDRDRFLGRRRALRDILARYLAVSPADVHLAEGQAEKPRLAAPASPLLFNASASGDLALVAVSRDAEVGIDVERIRDDLDVERLAARSLSPTETAALAALDPDERTRGFFRAWVRKEAYLKAKGIGLFVPLDAVSVSLSPTEPPQLLHSAVDPRDHQRWRLWALDAGAAYAAALAAPAWCQMIRLWDWERSPC
jgi:4'-phosphopantetheinyl transferase